MARRFRGKAIVVIGRAAYLAFAAEGGRILAADMDSAKGERTAALREAGGEAFFKQVDVSRNEDGGLTAQ